MWRLKAELQNHSTVDLGLDYETPALAYEAVEAFYDQAIKFEEKCYADIDLGYDAQPADGSFEWYAWLVKHGWPEGGVPVITCGDRTMCDIGDEGFTEVDADFNVIKADGLEIIDWLEDAIKAGVLPTVKILSGSGFSKEAIADHYRAEILKNKHYT